MSPGKIPVLFDIVERGRNAPKENMLKPSPAGDEIISDAANEDPTVVPASRPGPTSVPDDLEITGERTTLPIDEMPFEPDNSELVEEVMAELMPRLETLARKTVEYIIAKKGQSEEH